MGCEQVIVTPPAEPVITVTGDGCTVTVMDPTTPATIEVGCGAGLSPEQIQDLVALLLVAGAGISLSYDDGAGSLTVSALMDAEAVRDTIGATLVAGSGIGITVNDPANTITISSLLGTQEQIEDIVAGLLVAGSGIGLAYNDAANSLTISATGGGSSLVDPAVIYALGADWRLWFIEDGVTLQHSHAERFAVGSGFSAVGAWPDGPIGFTPSASGGVWAFGALGGSPNGIIRTTVDETPDPFTLDDDPRFSDVAGVPPGVIYTAGGPAYRDPSTGRIVVMAHQEGASDFIALCTSTDGGVTFSSVGDIPAVGFGTFAVDDTGMCHMYEAEDDGDCFLWRFELADLLSWAAGGSEPAWEVWTGSTWSTTVASKAAIFTNDSQSGGNISDLAWLPGLRRYVALSNSQGPSDWVLAAAIIDPATPHLVPEFSPVYRSPSDGPPKALGAGYVSMFAPNRQVDTPYVDVVRVDPQDPDPGQPWDDTILTRVRIRPVIDRHREPAIEWVDVVGTVASASGSTVTTFPDYQPGYTATSRDCFVWNQATSLWTRYQVSASNVWTAHPDQPQVGDIIGWHNNSGVTPYDGRVFHMAVRNTGASDGVQPVSEDRVLALAALATKRFVYDSSAAATNTTFNSWSLLMTALTLYANAEIHFAQNETLPAGAWDLNGATLHGNDVTAAGGGIVVTVPTGCTFVTSGLTSRFLRNSLTLVSTSTAPVVTVSASATYVLEGAIASTTKEFFDFTGSGVYILAFGANGGFLLANTNLGFATDYEVMNISGTPAFWGVVHVEGFNFLRDNTIRGTTGGLRIVQSVTADLTEGNTQTNLTGGLTTVLQTRADDLGYSPAVAGDWSPAPNQTAAALDQLAARATRLGSGSHLAGANLSGHRLVTLDSAGDAIYADSATAAHRDRIVGLVLTAATTGDPVTVQYEGDVTEGTWSWTPGATLFASTSGNLTETPPSLGGGDVFSQRVGWAVTATRIYIDLSRPGIVL